MTDSSHYEKNGQRIGAISATEIGALIQNRTIDGKTLVWSQGLADWTPLAETDLAVHLRQASAPPALPATRIGNTTCGSGPPLCDDLKRISGFGLQLSSSLDLSDRLRQRRRLGISIVPSPR